MFDVLFIIESQRWLQPKMDGDAPPPRGSHVLAAVGDSIVMYGGSSDFNRNAGHCTKHLNDTFILQASKYDVMYTFIYLFMLLCC